MMQIYLKIRFLHTLETGIRNGNVRNYIHLLLKNFTITDEELLECVTFAVSNESERPEKFSDKKKSDTSIYFIDEQQQKDNPFHLQIKELKLDHNKQLQAIRSEMKILLKSMYRPTETDMHAQFVQSQAPLNNTALKVTFLQNQQPAITHSMNPIMLPFLPSPNHRTRFLLQKNPKTTSPQNKNNITVLPSLRHPLHSNSFQCFTCCETQSCSIHCLLLLINRIPEVAMSF